eukprot:9797148-Lingulodinium_polyedra.AAC.1
MVNCNLTKPNSSTVCYRTAKQSTFTHANDARTSAHRPVQTRSTVIKPSHARVLSTSHTVKQPVLTHARTANPRDCQFIASQLH